MVHVMKETRTKHLVESEQRGDIRNMGCSSGQMYEVTVIAVKQWHQ